MPVNKNPMYQFHKQTEPLKRTKPRINRLQEPTKELVFLDISQVAPSPSRDYFRLRVTANTVCLTQWRISHKAKIQPVEDIVQLSEVGADPNLSSEICRVFGKSTADYVIGLGQGKVDIIIRLPTKVLALIMEYVGIPHLAKLAPVCKRFQDISSGNTLWKGFYGTYVKGRQIDEETQLNANYLGWKTTFFINRLQDRAFPGKKMRLGVKVDEPLTEFLEAQARRMKQKRLEAFSRGSVSSTGVLPVIKEGSRKTFKPILPPTSRLLKGGKTVSSPALGLSTSTSYAQIRASLGLKPKPPGPSIF